MNRKRYRKESGVSLVEYVVAVSLLGTVFLVGSSTLTEAGERAATRSVNTVVSMTPCVLGEDGRPQGLLGDGANECW